MLNPIDYSISKFITFIDDETHQYIRNVSTTKHFKKGTVIETRGQIARHIYLIENGLVQVGINGADGSQFNLTRIGSGHTFGETAFFLNQKVIHDAYAESDVVLRQLSRQNIDDLMQSSLIFSKALVSVACMRVQTTLSHIGDTLGMPLYARTAKQILSISHSVGNAKIINLRQVDLAHSLGVSRVSIGKALKTLSDKKLIKIGYGKLEIISHEVLANTVHKNQYNH
ncbi:MAG: Crp/Fnr family transcriptional regulator [Maricaulaceae bacterium]